MCVPTVKLGSDTDSSSSQPSDRACPLLASMRAHFPRIFVLTAARPGRNLDGMTDGDTSPDDASDPAGSGRAHGTAEPRPRWPTPMERIWAHHAAKLRQWSLAHPDPYLAPPTPDAPSAPEPDDQAPEPEPPAPAGATAKTHADHTDRP